MIHVRSQRLVAVEPEWIRGAGSIGGIQVWILSEQSGSQAIHGRRICHRVERWLTGRIQRLGVSAKVVIERNVFAKNHDDVLDGSDGLWRRWLSRRGETANSDSSEQGSNHGLAHCV